MIVSARALAAAASGFLEVDPFDHRQPLQEPAQTIEGQFDRAQSDPFASAQDPRAAELDPLGGGDADADGAAEVDPIGAVIQRGCPGMLVCGAASGRPRWARGASGASGRVKPCMCLVNSTSLPTTARATIPPRVPRRSARTASTSRRAVVGNGAERAPVSTIGAPSGRTSSRMSLT